MCLEHSGGYNIAVIVYILGSVNHSRSSCGVNIYAVIAYRRNFIVCGIEIVSYKSYALVGYHGVAFCVNLRAYRHRKAHSAKVYIVLAVGCTVGVCSLWNG